MSPKDPIKPIRVMKARKQLALLAIMAAVWVIATSFAAAQEPKPANPVGAQPVSAAKAPDKLESLPASEFSRIVREFSEEGGYFRSDNFTSNETAYLTVVDTMRAPRRFRRGLSRSGAGTEFHLHRQDSPAHRLHRGHPPPGDNPAPDVQGCLPPFAGSRPISLAPLEPAIAEGEGAERGRADTRDCRLFQPRPSPMKRRMRPIWPRSARRSRRSFNSRSRGRSEEFGLRLQKLPRRRARHRLQDGRLARRLLSHF